MRPTGTSSREEGERREKKRKKRQSKRPNAAPSAASGQRLRLAADRPQPSNASEQAQDKATHLGWSRSEDPKKLTHLTPADATLQTSPSVTRLNLQAFSRGQRRFLIRSRGHAQMSSPSSPSEAEIFVHFNRDLDMYTEYHVS